MTVALIVAAGEGQRLRAGVPKALVQLAGRPLLQWSIDAIAAVPEVRRIVVALPQGTCAPPGVTGVAGGGVRSDSVRRALAACAEGDPVLVHDAARPLVTAELAASVLAALAGDQTADAAVAAVPVSDTVKSRTLDRRWLWAVQTPQVFRRPALERALDVPAEVLAQATDDAWLIERAGGKVIVVPAAAENIKVTTPLDLQLAELLLDGRRQSGGAAAAAANPA